MERKTTGRRRRMLVRTTSASQRRRTAVAALPAPPPRLRNVQGGTIHRQDLYKVPTVLTTDAGGEINVHFAVTPRTLSTNFSTYSAIYDAYQVQKMTITIYPAANSTNYAVTPGWAVSGIDRNSAQNPTDSKDVMRRPGYRKHNFQDNKPFKLEWKILPEEKSTWTAVASDQVGCIQFACGNGGNAANICFYITDWVVMWKGRT